MKKTLIMVICAFSYVCINGQIVTDRPDQTESSSTVGKGNLQIESGVLLAFEGNNQTSSRQILAPTNLFRVGISKNFELRLLSQFETFKNDNPSVQGISDLEVGTKIQLFKKEGINTEIAFLSHLSVPSGSKELTNDGYGTINKLSISHSLNENMGLGYNLGYNYFGQDNGDLTYSFALGYSINENVGVYLEPYGAITNIDQHVSNFDTGFTYLPNENMQFDFSFGVGINHRMNYVSIGFSWLIIGDK